MPKDTSKNTNKRREIKDKVLQARIPDKLDEELRNHAQDLGLSVSAVVRNVLQNTFQLVEGVVSDSSQAAKAFSASQQAQPGHSDDRAESFSGRVLGWQDAILNVNGVCEECNAVLLKGSNACIGIPAQSRATFLCVGCLTALQTKP